MKYFILFFVLLTACNRTSEQYPEDIIKESIEQQLNQYPTTRLQDIYKNFYQARFGGEHAITDTEAVVRYTRIELESIDSTNLNPDVEMIGWEENFMRVSLLYIKKNNIDPDILSDCFIRSGEYVDTNKTVLWEQEWRTIIKIIERDSLYPLIIEYHADKQSIDSIMRMRDIPALHHSTEYKSAYQPHYRIVAKPLFEKYLKID